MIVYIPNFGAGEDIEDLIREFVGREQEKWFYYRSACIQYISLWGVIEWEDSDYGEIRKYMFDEWIGENAPEFVRDIYYSVDEEIMVTDAPYDESELEEEFYNEILAVERSELENHVID